jgi:hypothetical protein
MTGRSVNVHCRGGPDAKIEKMMKLRSWNRFLGVVPTSRSTLEDAQSLGPGVEDSSTL